jgi:hypothetical protein
LESPEPFANLAGRTGPSIPNEQGKNDNGKDKLVLVFTRHGTATEKVFNRAMIEIFGMQRECRGDAQEIDKKQRRARWRDTERRRRSQ